MADNFATNPGSGGSTFASDDVGSVQYPRVKRSFGRDGIAQDVGTGFRKKSAASNNATVLKAGPGTLFSLFAVNLNAAVRYLKFYNLTSTPAPATDTPVAVFPIPASSTGAGFSIDLGPGFDFSTGIGYAIVTGASDTDNTSVAADEIFLVGTYA